MAVSAAQAATATTRCHWLKHYNHTRPHSGIANRPPISRVHDLRVQEQLVSFSDRGGPGRN
ncbi:MAG: hypothetical protein ACLPTJ_03630 [Solirubrobacteraceae bacterium]